MSEYEDPDMRWARPRGSTWDRLWGRRARKALAHNGCFGRERTVVGGREGQARCYDWGDQVRFVDV